MTRLARPGMLKLQGGGMQKISGERESAACLLLTSRGRHRACLPRPGVEATQVDANLVSAAGIDSDFQQA